MPFEFRLRFHLLPADRIDSSETVLPMPTATHLRLVPWKTDTTIGDSARVFLVGGPFETRDEAETDGQRARRALLLWAVQRRLPVDLGDGRRRGGLTAAGIEWLTQRLGSPVRDQLHGLDIYEIVPGQRFVNTEAEAALQMLGVGVVERIDAWYVANPILTAKQSLAAELYCAAGFDSPFRSRFLTLMTAIEALLEYQPRSGPVRELVQSLEDAVKASSILKAEKASLNGSLQWLYEESIGQAGRRTTRQLLPDKTYGGQASVKYFSDCYELRSTIVHSGRIPDSVDLLDAANQLQQFVGDLLHASIGIPAV